MKAAGLTIVGVLPTHRRRGYLTRDDALADRCGARARRAASRFCGPPRTRSTAASATAWPRWRPRSISPREHAAPFARDRNAGTGAACDARRGRAAGRSGLRARRAPDARHVPRASAWWQDRLLIDHPWRRQARRRAALRCLGTRRAGRPPTRSIASTRRSSAATPPGTSSWSRRWASTPEATHAIWRFLFGIDFVARLKAIYLPLDHPLLTLAGGAAAAEFPRARRPVGAADRRRRGAVGARLCDRRCAS